MGMGIGKIGWLDLTIENADQVRDFYAAVVGWEPEGCDMGGYEDYNMKDPGEGQARAGICHKKNSNASQPSVWMPYFTVADLQASMTEVVERGGKVLVDRSDSGNFVVIQDPSGAICALYHEPS